MQTLSRDDLLFALLIVAGSLLPVACGDNAGGDDAWPCCYGDEYYACPNKSAQMNCESAKNFDPINCTRDPHQDDVCE